MKKKEIINKLFYWDAVRQLRSTPESCSGWRYWASSHSPDSYFMPPIIKLSHTVIYIQKRLMQNAVIIWIFSNFFGSVANYFFYYYYYYNKDLKWLFSYFWYLVEHEKITKLSTQLFHFNCQCLRKTINEGLIIEDLTARISWG